MEENMSKNRKEQFVKIFAKYFDRKVDIYLGFKIGLINNVTFVLTICVAKTIPNFYY